MHDEFDSYFQSYKKYEKERDEYRKKTSKDKLIEQCRKKIETTMIGAISTLEKYLSEELANDTHFKEVFNLIRSEILDKGNNQIRMLNADFKFYEVKYNKQTFFMPIRKTEE